MPDAVPFEVARRADTMIREFFIPHAEQFYDLLDGGGSAHRVRSVATAILRCPKDEIVLRDVVHRCRVMRGKERDEQIRLMQRFETFGWLTRLDRHGNAHPRWRRTPGLGRAVRGGTQARGGGAGGHDGGDQGGCRGEA